jgi:large subunit ribosomal protein L3
LSSNAEDFMANEQSGLIGTKVGMTQFFRDDGTILPVTIVQAGPCTVLRVKTEDSRDGYNALQLGFGTQKPQRLNRPRMGEFSKLGLQEAPPRHVKEIRVTKEAASAVEVGSTLGAGDVFKEGERVDVIGISKGAGFAGVMKRYNFRGFIRSHGVHEFFRHGGSIGTRLTPGHVLKGKKMPGHMGAEQVTVQNIEVVKVDAERNLVYLRGGVPGPKGALVTVRKAVKA